MSAPPEKPPRPVRASQRPTAPVIDLTGRTSRPPSRPPSGFAAQIEGASIADLIQLECTRGLTRAVRVTAGTKSGFLYFDEGDLVHAVAGQLKGEDAAREILKWEGGTVRPSDSYWVNPPTINMSWQALLIAAAYAEDESGRGESEVVARVDLETVEQDVSVEEPSVTPEKQGITRMVSLDSEGNVLRGEGDVGEFPDAAAYCVRLAQLIGEELGLEPFQGLECATSEMTMVAYLDGDKTFALEAKAGTDLGSHRKKAGL